MNLSGIRDSPERTVPDLSYPLKRPRPTTMVVTVTFGEVDTCSISTGDGRTEGTNRFELRSVTGSKRLVKMWESGCVYVA